MSQQFTAILLLIGMTIIKPKILALADNNLQHQKYDYIDVAKQTMPNNGRNKGHTTRIFTTAKELDEEFWLKYLGEDFHQAVHLEVDNNNNIMKQDAKRSQTEKRTRFARQPLQDDKQNAEDSVNKEIPNQYPTEKPEIFNENLNISRLPVPKHEPRRYSNNNEKISKHKNKLLVHNNYKQKIEKTSPPSTPLKAIYEPIVVNLPEVVDNKQQINNQPHNVPVIFQIPPVIYHQKAAVLQLEKHENSQLLNHNNNLFNDNIPSLSLGNQNLEFYYEKEIQNPTHLGDNHPNFALSSHQTVNNENEHTMEHPLQTGSHHLTLQETENEYTMEHTPYRNSQRLILHNKIPQYKHSSPSHPTKYTTYSQMKQPYSHRTRRFSLMPPTQFSITSFLPELLEESGP